MNLNPMASARRCGFTWIELLVVIAVLAISLGLVLPASNKARIKAQVGQCMDNKRQLMLAWKLYCDDNSQRVPSAGGRAGDWWPVGPMTWTGNSKTDGANQNNWNPEVTVKKSPLWPYCSNNPAIFQCPTDTKYSCTYQGKSYPRVRNVSMLSWFNGADALSVSGTPGYVVYGQTTDVLKPGPAMTMVFLDERVDSINDGEYSTSMFGWDPYQPASWRILDIPGNRVVDVPGVGRIGFCVVAFADGHAEIHKWEDAALNIPMGHGPNITAPDSKDAYWLMEHSTRKP